MKHKKSDPRQLELWADYRSACAELHTATLKVEKAHRKLLKAGVTPAEIAADAETKSKRDRFVKAIRYMAMDKGIKFEDMFRAIYRHMKELFNFDPTLYAILHGYKTKVDGIIAAGRIDQALITAAHYVSTAPSLSY